MGRTLLVGTETGAWREWLRAERAGRRLLCLDPADADFGFPARLAVYEDEKCLAWRFLGGLSAIRCPHGVVAAVAALLDHVGPDGIVELFPYRPSPLRLQLARAIAERVRPELILLDRRARVSAAHFPGRAVETDLVAAPSAAVQAGYRKARWLQMIEQCEPHELDLRDMAIDGARLGSGTPIPLENLRKYGFTEPLHGETAGNTMLVVSEADVDDLEVTRALDAVHAERAVVVSPTRYRHLLCAFAQEDGDDFGIGRIESIDFPNHTVRVSCNAVAGTPVPVLRLGGLRVDEEGKELGESRPWDL